MESDRSNRAGAVPLLRIRLLGPLRISRGEAVLPLPTSRKVRALLAYLALEPHAVARSRLCELLWDVPNDPRGELRWCLSKIRGLIDEPGRRRVLTRADTVEFDLADCRVDAVEIARATRHGIETLAPERLRTLAALFEGDVLDGLEIDRCPDFSAWLTAQRRRWRACRAALLEQLAGRVPDDEALAYLETWLELAPFDPRIHEFLLNVLARQGRIREGEEHLAAAARLFGAEGLDCTALHDAWRSARAQADGSSHARATAPPVTVPWIAASLVTAVAGGRADGITILPRSVASRRASIAVMPFVDRSAAADSGGGTADALTDDVITRLAKLRCLFVIAQGTMFALRERRTGSGEADRMLNVDYLVNGSVQRQGRRLVVTVELVEMRSARIAWAEDFDRKSEDVLLVLDEIGDRIVASIANEIETIERNRAILKPPNSLDAWEAYHRGLWHMYRFNQLDNVRARRFFERAVNLDPTFARAHAGLSFTHFQNAFQGWAKRGPEIDLAFEAAGQSLMADDRDPAAHWAMGRALWLRGRHDLSVVELCQAVDLSPNFVQGHYALAFVQSQAGDPRAAISSSDHSRRLSPFDPLLFAMLGARAMALVRLGRFEEAADWAIRAAARPNAHVQIQAIAAFSLALAGRPNEARAYLATIRKMLPNYRVTDFLTAMQFAPEGERLFREGAKRIGLA